MHSLLRFGGTAALLLLGTAASAETLQQALLRAYATNPSLTAARARLRATDENIALAKAQGRPQLTASAGFTESYEDIGGRDLGGTGDVSGQASYSLFAGGRIRNSARAADARVMASRADLRALEGDIFAQVVAVYSDVVRDAYIVSLNRNQVRVLETNFAASKSRFQAGDLTRTDVAQSEARLASARAQLSNAEGRLVTNRESYRRITGAWPENLDPAPDLPPLPADPDAAVETGLANAPDLEAVRQQNRATGIDVDVARASRLPTVTANTAARYTRFFDSQSLVGGGAGLGSGFSGSTTQSSVGISAQLPLYQGGGPAARVRQAKALNDESLEQAVAVERGVIADVRSAYASHIVAIDTIRANEVAVGANKLALDGTRAEQGVGTRLLLDVLNAEQELLNSQVNLVSARRDEYVAGFNLLNAMGRADLRSLNLEGGVLYDPDPSYRRAKRSLSDWNDGVPVTVEATRTVGPTPDTPATTIQPITADRVPQTESERVTRPALQGMGASPGAPR